MEDQNAVKIALVISDIDGTLITSNHELSDETKKAARELQNRGIHLSLASSRPPRSIRPLAEELGLQTPFAAFNGGLVTKANGEVEAQSLIPAAITARIKAIADDLGLAVWLYDCCDWYVPGRDPFVDREEHTSGFSPNIDQYTGMLETDLNKLTVVGIPDHVAEAERRTLAQLGTEVSASRSKPRFLDVTAYGWDKGSVVERVANLLGIPVEQTAAIGDGPNDVQMFKQAGISIAMGEAVEEVRKAARYWTSSNDDEGWARGIRRYVLGQAESAGAWFM